MKEAGKGTNGNVYKLLVQGRLAFGNAPERTPVCPGVSLSEQALISSGSPRLSRLSTSSSDSALLC